MQRISVLGSHYSLCRREQLNAALVQDALAMRTGYVCVANVHTTMMGFFDHDYQRITNESLYSIPDGLPLVWAMNLLGAADIIGRGQDRTRGPTLMREICSMGRATGRAEGLKHYLYGGSEKALAALAEYLRTTYPGVEIVGMESPPFRALSDAEMAASAARINESGAHILWVGLGAPKQERWMFQQRSAVKPLMLGVGAAFDLLPGIVPEAPAWMQAMGLEWLYRFYREPRRLWRRYILNNPLFLVLLGWQLLARLVWRKKYFV